MPDYKWPEANERRVIGKPLNRSDGIAKATGAAKYSFDINRPGMLWGKLVTCPHAHAKIKSVDTSAAEAIPGVKAVYIIEKTAGVPQDEMKWHGDVVAAVAADTEEHARDGARAVKVEYEVLPHLVNDTDLKGAAEDAKKAAGKQEQPENANLDEVFKRDDVVSVEGNYGIHMINHCCLEPHGLVAEWTAADELTVYLSTQNVSGHGGQLGGAFKIPAGNVRTICDYMGGGFGSKFSADRWDRAAAELAKKTGKAVKIMLDRDEEQMTAGSRPSGFGRIKVGATKDGSIVAWDSEHWGTGGATGGVMGVVVMPYVFTGIPTRRSVATAITTNIGPNRAWRAPNHPQGAALTMAALADVAAAINMDELEFFKKNVKLTGMADIYAEELDIAAKMINWKKKWHPRGDKTPGPIKRGLGISIHTWGGRPHDSKCDVTINPDGSVVLQLGSQDLGTGTRTVLAMVGAETFGLKPNDIKVNIGDSRYKQSGASGGSTTVGGVCSSSRRGCLDALAKLFETVGPALDAKPEDLEAIGGKVQVKGNAAKSFTWKQACARLGMNAITVEGAQPGPSTGEFKLASSGVGGVQIADVSVDIETGVVSMNEFVAVQDQGLVINPKTCTSQIYGAVIMGITSALMEEIIHDPITGRRLNPDMEFYKLAGIGDIGNIKVHLLTGKFKGQISGNEVDIDAKGVIGNGEPPVISPGAAIANAVANAIGVRVPVLPLTADRVLAALAKKGAVA